MSFDEFSGVENKLEQEGIQFKAPKSGVKPQPCPTFTKTGIEVAHYYVLVLMRLCLY